MSTEHMRADREYIQALLWEKAAGTIDEDDNRFIERLIAEDPGTAWLWADIREKLASGEGRMFAGRLNEDDAWQRLQPHLATASSHRRQWAYGIAASIAVICMAVYFLGFLPEDRQSVAVDADAGIHLELSDGKIVSLGDVMNADIDLGAAKIAAGEQGGKLSAKANAPAEWTTLVVPPTKDYRIVLSDGSQVWLNASSTLRFPLNFTDSLREVFLDGEGYFQVAKIAASPFVVHAGNTSIRVLGTAFNVNAYADTAVATALVEGSVLAKAGPFETLLEPGYQTVSNTGRPFATMPFDREQVLSWMQGTYYFHDQRLSDIADIMARWFNVHVVIGSQAAAAAKFTGRIRKDQPLDVFISNLELTSAIRATREGDTLYLK